jgi:hypothetical protein
MRLMFRGIEWARLALRQTSSRNCYPVSRPPVTIRRTNMMDDVELLCRYADTRDETVFTELVQRHLDRIIRSH